MDWFNEETSDFSKYLNLIIRILSRSQTWRISKRIGDFIKWGKYLKMGQGIRINHQHHYPSIRALDLEVGAKSDRGKDRISLYPWLVMSQDTPEEMTKQPPRAEASQSCKWAIMTMLIKLKARWPPYWGNSKRKAQCKQSHKIKEEWNLLLVRKVIERVNWLISRKFQGAVTLLSCKDQMIILWITVNLIFQDEAESTTPRRIAPKWQSINKDRPRLILKRARLDFSSKEALFKLHPGQMPMLM